MIIELKNGRKKCPRQPPSGDPILVLSIQLFPVRKFWGKFFRPFFRALEIPHLSVINLMMKPPNPAQKF